jgi:hypothetical protein
MAEIRGSTIFHRRSTKYSTVSTHLYRSGGTVDWPDPVDRWKAKASVQPPGGSHLSLAKGEVLPGEHPPDRAFLADTRQPAAGITAAGPPTGWSVPQGGRSTSPGRYPSREMPPSCCRPSAGVRGTARRPSGPPARRRCQAGGEKGLAIPPRARTACAGLFMEAGNCHSECRHIGSKRMTVAWSERRWEQMTATLIGTENDR